MDLRLAMYQLADAHRLSAPATARLDALAGFGREPDRLAHWLPRGLAVVAAALCGFGLVLWVAANWDTLGRFGRFAVLEAVLIVACAVAWRRSAAAVVPASLLVLLSIGGLFAYFGQTYQTGADPWQLFAMWAGLAIPLCFGARSDVVWAPWALVAMAAVSLWVRAHTGFFWRAERIDLPVYLAGWTAACLVLAALSPALRSRTGAGLWAFRTALTLFVVMVTSTALLGLFDSHVLPYYGIGLVVLAVAAAALCSRAGDDIYGLSAVALGLNALLVAGLGRVLLEGSQGEPIPQLLVLGLVAAGLLAATVTGVLHLARHRALHGDAT